MSYNELSGEEKKQIVRSQIKNLQYNKYGTELNILQEQAFDEPNELIISTLQEEIIRYNTKEQVLSDRLAELVLEYPEEGE